MAYIDNPQLNRMHMTFFNQINFDHPRLTQFLNITPTLRESDESHVLFNNIGADVLLQCPISENRIGGLEMTISCKEPDWQLSSIEHVCNSSLPTFSTVEDLYIEHQYLEPVWNDDAIKNTLCLEALLPFTAVKNLYLSKEFAPAIARARWDQKCFPACRISSLRAQAIGTFPGKHWTVRCRATALQLHNRHFRLGLRLKSM